MESLILANYKAGNTERAFEVFQILKFSYTDYPGIPEIDKILLE